MASVNDIVSSMQEPGTKKLNFHVKTLRNSNWLELVYFYDYFFIVIGVVSLNQ